MDRINTEKFDTLQTGTYARQQQKIVHSNLADIMLELEVKFADYKYTVYRAAAKFVFLQKRFFTAYMPYKVVLAVLNRHRMQEDDINLMVPPFQLTTLLQDIFTGVEQLGHFSKLHSFNLETATAVLCSFFWNVFDPRRYHSVSVLEIKLALLCLCKLQHGESLNEEIFTLIQDPRTHYVSKYNFEYLCSSLAKLLTYIGEDSAYGTQNVKPILEQSLSKYQNKVGFTKQQFIHLWTKADTRVLIYAHLLSLIKRIEETELLVHNNICAACRITPIVGIRFKCQTCRNLSLCLKCFASGFNNNRHQSGHRMYEAFTEDLPPKKISHYFAKICNLLLTSRRQEETREFCYLTELTSANETEIMSVETSPIAIPNNASAETSTMGTVAEVAVTVNNLANTCLQVKRNNSEAMKQTLEALETQASLAGLTETATNALNVSERLQNLIDRLLHQNAKLETLLKCIQSLSHDQICNFLKAHQKFLLEIINEMRSFDTHNNLQNNFPAASTPTLDRSLTSAFKSTQEETNVCNMSDIGSTLTQSINGADINRSYLDANKSDLSINDVSIWFNQCRSSALPQNGPSTCPLTILPEMNASDIDSKLRETGMKNFKLLLLKVKEIVDDSYSENIELSEATNHLESVLDNIIKSEKHLCRQSN